MKNRDLAAARKYHERTKHSYDSVRTNPHFLDWSNQPRPYKVYVKADSILLPKPEAGKGPPALRVLIGGLQPSAARGTSLRDLSAILHYSAGITRRRRTYGGSEICFRAAACTGALYSIELYVVSGDLDDLPAGVYLFSPIDSSLKVIRRGDHRAVLAHAAADEPAVARAEVNIVCTGTFWRNAWKYQARTYRHFGWDNGTILANLIAGADARGLPSRIVLGFVDEEVNRLLDTVEDQEVALSIVALGRAAAPPADPPEEVSRLHLQALPYSPLEVKYPQMVEIHEASSLESPDEVRAWRRAAPAAPPRAGASIPLRPTAGFPDEPIEQAIQRRGSTRQFSHESISFEELSTALACAAAPLHADFLETPEARLNDLYVVAHAVDGLSPGAYFFDPGPEPGLDLIREGDFRSRTGYLGLEQELPRDCSAAVFFLADLDGILERFGNRGYRAVQLEAGIRGGRLYLAAYAQRFGATGLTFYDDDVAEFFSPHAAGKSAIFLTALGRRATMPFRVV